MRPNTARNADINTQITETVRMRHDLYRQVTNTNIDIENVLLTKRSYEARGQEYFTNQAYFDALKVAEERARALENNRIEARRAERDMPEVVFRPSDAGPAAEVAIQRLARRVVANEPSHNVYAETRRIWDFIHEMENAVAVYPDDTPEFIINDQRVLVVNDARTEFYPFKYIYVRQCYEDLLPKIMDTAKDSVVTILGDSGIGTSTFLRYLFANIIVNPKYKQKVFWQRESGFWRYFDGETRHCGVEDTDVWRKPDVLLLLDGTLQPKHYQKLKNVLIVCSLESENYDRMIKASSDVAFVMPCWSIEEVKKVSNISVETVAGNFVVTSNILSENMKVFYDNLRQQVAPLVPQASENPADKSYHEEEAILILNEVDFLKLEVLKRFELVGGRIRFLLHNYNEFSQLKEQVLRSVYAVTVGKLKRFDCLYFDHNPPSFIFSVVQEEDSIYPSVYRLQFASPFITKHVTSRIILEFGGKINNLLAECMYQEVGGSLIEKIFACFLLQGLQLRKICSITGRKLESTRPLMDTLPDLTINFANCEIMNYSILTRDLRSIISDGLRTNKLLLQIQVNASCVDAVFYDGQRQKCYFIKITISINYPFNYLNVSDLAESLGINDHNLIDFVYLVPKDAYCRYRLQKVENAPMRNDYGFKQHIFFVPDIDNISFSIRD